MLTELIIFAVVLVTLQMVSGVIVTYVMFKKFTSKKFIKQYFGEMMELSKELQEEMLEKYFETDSE